MKYQDKLYSSYVSGHTSYLYGPASIEKIKKQFPVWKSYFGKLLPKEKKARILDLGCGNGAFIYFLKSVGFEYIQGVDISAEQIDEARRLGINGVSRSDLDEFLSDKKEVYDIIFARDILEHFKKEDTLDVLAHIYSALHDDGMLVIQTPNAESPFAARYRYWEFTHEVSFTCGSLRALLLTAGFRNMNFYPAGPVPKGIFSAGRFLIWKIIESFLSLYLLAETGTGKGIFTQNIIAAARKNKAYSSKRKDF